MSVNELITHKCDKGTKLHIYFSNACSTFINVVTAFSFHSIYQEN